jgi:hypothetical protein
VSELHVEDRLLYYREIRRSLRSTVRPLLDDVLALEALTTIDRLLVGLITIDEHGPALSAEFGARVHAVVHGSTPAEPVTPDEFSELLRPPPGAALSFDQQRALVGIELEYLTGRAEVLAGVMGERDDD